jgi:hypothetical protein
MMEIDENLADRNQDPDLGSLAWRALNLKIAPGLVYPFLHGDYP